MAVKQEGICFCSEIVGKVAERQGIAAHRFQDIKLKTHWQDFLQQRKSMWCSAGKGLPLEVSKLDSENSGPRRAQLLLKLQ